MTWTTERCSQHPAKEAINGCCELCVWPVCSYCLGELDVRVTFADDDEDGEHPLTVEKLKEEL
jgi:hypothetical protein